MSTNIITYIGTQRGSCKWIKIHRKSCWCCLDMGSQPSHQCPTQSGRTVAVTFPYFFGWANSACETCAQSSWQRSKGKEGEDARASASCYELRIELVKNTKTQSKNKKTIYTNAVFQQKQVPIWFLKIVHYIKYAWTEVHISISAWIVPFWKCLCSRADSSGFMYNVFKISTFTTIDGIVL